MMDAINPVYQWALDFYHKCYDMAPDSANDWAEVKAFADFMRDGTLPKRNEDQA